MDKTGKENELKWKKKKEETGRKERKKEPWESIGGSWSAGCPRLAREKQGK